MSGRLCSSSCCQQPTTCASSSPALVKTRNITNLRAEVPDIMDIAESDNVAILELAGLSLSDAIDEELKSLVRQGPSEDPSLQVPATYPPEPNEPEYSGEHYVLGWELSRERKNSSWR
ncbi:hypothetical protein NUW54_g5959 [Trametes sanguinea]|uniref:Uncharacterized protein n=1 Tax=Trametes sanguinea TaxID=158606 RepID=A0ACC1PTM4_9APHY|nr:hypothetical protein NUW54_g5959 [Trametes sanguinea]